MALRATDGTQRATVSDIRGGTYLSGRKRLWYVIALLEGDGEVVIEDCAKPDDPPQVWTPTRFLSVWGPLAVVDLVPSPG